MSYLALYRKYRPSSFDQVYGQKFIVDIIKNSVINNRISHAYLFSGPRGTGKTTIAKMLAKLVNCSNCVDGIACEECESCSLLNLKINPDVIEMDAASNNGVDEIRNIIDKVSLMPSVSKYKVYIIDEVHMLSNSAFNALLKTIEEPPEHVIFILATTELYKVPETIVSRCQCYEFERISKNDIVACLKRIASLENFDIEDGVFELIAEYSNGGMRDSISLLDKLSSCANSITVDLFYQIVGLVDESIISDLIMSIVNIDYNKSLSLVDDFEKSGKNIQFIINQILNFLKNIIINDNDFVNKNSCLVMIEEFNNLFSNMKNISNLYLSFQLCVIKIISKLDGFTVNNKISDNQNISREIKSDFVNNSSSFETTSNVKEILNDDISNDNKENITNSKQMIAKPEIDFSVTINNAFALADKNLKNDMLANWKGFYDYIHNKEFSSVVSYFLDSNLEVAGAKDVIISVSNNFNIDNIYLNFAKLELLFNLVMGKSYNIAFVFEKDWDLLKTNYISNLKNGKKYEYIEQIVKNNDIIDTVNVVSDFDNSSSAKTAQNLFGNDIVEIK